ncbi:MAG: Ig-like domain-containing protein [Armatimonadota bacterium]
MLVVRPLKAVWLMAVMLLCALPLWSADWALWESPYGNTEVLDQSQSIGNTGSWGIMYTNPVGQTFTPQVSPLVRMDFMVDNRFDFRPFSVKLWQWNTNYATTVAQPPLFEDTVTMPGLGGPTLYSVFPNIPITPGVLHYVEFYTFPGAIGIGEWSIYGTNDGVEYYPAGQLYVNGLLRNTADIYLKTYTTPQGTLSLPTFASSDPGLPWTAPAAPGPAPDAAEYFNHISTYTASIRSYYLTTPSPYGAYYAMYEAFLYRATSTETYAQNAITMFERTYEYIQAHPGTFMGLPYEAPHFAYLWIKSSPNLTQTNRDHIQEMFVAVARNWWPGRAGGIQNQPFMCMMNLKLCLNEFSGALTTQEITDWTAYSDGIWNEFETYWDIDEDSGSYGWFSLRLAAQLAVLYGEDSTIWQEPGFKALVDRFYRQSLPLGPGPSQGATYGWGQVWATAVWIFERAAKEYNEPKYRWAAYRAYDYQRQYLKYPAFGADLAAYNERFALCHAYFGMNETLPVTEPVQTEVLAARQDQSDGHSGWIFSPTNLLGQTFKPTATPLVRLDLQVMRSYTPAVDDPGAITIWKWNTDLATTRAQTPLYRDSIDLVDCYGVWKLRSLYPFLDVEVGATYYMEFSRDVVPFETFFVRSSVATYDYYPDGQLLINNAWRPTWDLWFKTYTLSDLGSNYTNRQGVAARRVSQRGSPEPRFFDWRDEIVPNKLTLKSSNNPDSFSMSVNLCVAPYGHGHQESGAIMAITAGGALIYGDGTYTNDDDQDHGMSIFKRYTGGNCATHEYRMFMNSFADYRKATVALLGHNDLAGWDVQRERRFFFVKDRFALVRDHAVTVSAIKAALGNVWHAHDVHPDHGTNWYEIYNREPLGINGWKFKNPQRSLLLYFVPRIGLEVAEWLEPSYPPTYPPANPPMAGYVLYQKLQGDFTPGQSIWTDTIMLPHGPEITPTQAATNASGMLYQNDTTGALAVQVIVGDETWTVVDNPTGELIDVTGLTTDARYLIACSKPATPDYLLVHEATTVQVGAINKTWAAAASVEIGGYNEGPFVDLTSPANGTVYATAPATVVMNATATDSDGTIDRVEFYEGENLLNTDTLAPYSYTWPNVPAGSYTLTAKAFDNDGVSSTSLARNIRVNAPPTVSITSPTEGTVFPTAPATVPITADAADSDGTVSKVEFYEGANLVGTDTNGADGWGYTWNDVAAGSYALTAKAYDNDNVPTTSAAVNIRVNAPPTVSITSPANNAVIIGNSLTMTADASDSDGSISKVEFYEGANLLGTDTTSADGWSYDWTSIPGGGYSLTAKAYDNDNVPTTSSAVNITVWNTGDIGAVGQTGSASYSSPTFTVAGAGAGITGSADAFRFVYHSMNGDCTITARVVSCTSNDNNARAGVMMRQDTAAGAKAASSLFAPSNNKVFFHYRTSTDGNTSTKSSNAAAAPYWVRLVRAGNTLRAYKSANGANWTQVGSGATVSMTDPLLVGLAVTSGTTAETLTATFDNVSITAP